MIQTTSQDVGQQLEIVLIEAGHVVDCEKRHFIKGQKDVQLSSIEYMAYLPSVFMDVETLSPGSFKKGVPAFTMGELWEMLPTCITVGGDRYHKSLQQSPHWVLSSFHNSDLSFSHIGSQESQLICDALAKLVMWCIKNGHPLNIPKS